MSKAKIFVIYHTQGQVVKSDVYQPICVGNNKKNFDPKVFLRDDTGENIAKLNATYNELTAIYWVYKHLKEFDDIEYVGFSHYRRLFCFYLNDKKSYVKRKVNTDMIVTNELELESIFKEYDLVAPCPMRYRSVKHHYDQTHNKHDINTLLDVIKEKHEKYYDAALDYFMNDGEFLYNMFIFKKEDFIEYCEFIFPLVKEFLDRSPNRYRLFVSERITGVFITHLLNKGFKPLYLPVLQVRRKNLKEGRLLTRNNFKNDKEGSFLFKIKPLALVFMPRHIEQAYRRKISK